MPKLLTDMRNRFPDSGAYNGWVAIQERIQAAKTAGNLTAKDSLSFIGDWKPVLTNPTLQIAQESMTGYKEGHDLGYQLRARCKLNRPPSCSKIS